MLFLDINPLSAVFIYVKARRLTIPAARPGTFMKGRLSMKSIWIRILVCILSLCLMLPVASCGRGTVEEETADEVTSHYVSVITRDEPSEEETTEPEEALEDTEASVDVEV